jgi:hypothetical protein
MTYASFKPTQTDFRQRIPKPGFKACSIALLTLIVVVILSIVVEC